MLHAIQANTFLAIRADGDEMFFSVKVKTHAGDTASLNVRTKRVTTIPGEIVRLSSMSIWYLQVHKQYRKYLVTSAKNRRATVRWR